MAQKVVLITGGTRSIGLATSWGFARAGYRVIMNYHSNDAAAESAKSELTESGFNIATIKADVSVAKDRKHLVAQTLKQFGAIDVLVNNAGVAQRGDFIDTAIEDYEHEIRCNLNGPVFLAQAVAKHMIDSETKGNIINICSIAGHRGLVSLGYAASKAGLLVTTKLMARELAKHGIRVNSISPGPIKTDINKSIRNDTPDIWDELMKTVPMKRGGEPEEIADMALVLASDASKYVTGADIVVDGGFLS